MTRACSTFVINDCIQRLTVFIDVFHPIHALQNIFIRNIRTDFFTILLNVWSMAINDTAANFHAWRIGICSHHILWKVILSNDIFPSVLWPCIQSFWRMIVRLSRLVGTKRLYCHCNVLKRKVIRVMFFTESNMIDNHSDCFIGCSHYWYDCIFLKMFILKLKY